MDCKNTTDICLEPNEYIEDCYCNSCNNSRSTSIYLKEWEIEKLEIEEKLAKRRRSESRNCFFITITCKPECESVDFINKVQKFIDSKSIERCFYNFEFRHNESYNNGIHSHIWIDKYKSSAFSQHVSRYMKNSGLFLHKDRFNKRYKREKFDYLIGKTWDKDKDNKKLLDINCRKDLGLSQIYNKNECEEYCDLCDEVNDVKKSNSLTSHNLVNNDKCIVRFD